MVYLHKLICGLLLTQFTTTNICEDKFDNQSPIVEVSENQPANDEKFVDENYNNEEVASVSIGYPFAKSITHYYVFINKKNVARVGPGERITIQLKNELEYQISIDESEAYKAPSYTQANNSRTMSLKHGKEYYFSIDPTGTLKYVFNPQNGAKDFNKAGDFKSGNPILITPVDTGEIPSL